MRLTLCKFRCSPVPSRLHHLLVSFVLLSSNLVSVTVSGQNTGTAVQLDNAELGTVNSHAANKARIQADLENEEQARKHAQNVVRLAATDQLNSEIITNRTRAYLSCESGEMIVKINFTEPFRGVGYSDYDRSSPCKFHGDGGRYYEMRMPLKGCGTKQEAPRIFINNIILRFHRSLELEEDEIKTIICRYPPPLAPPPPLIAAPILEQPPELAPLLPAKLSEVELMLIVSALLFLTLLLLGIGMGYYCLKRRNIKVVRKIPPSSPPSEFTYVPPIPRVSLSSSEASMISQSSSVRREDFRYDNLGYIPEPRMSHVDDFFRTEQYLTDEDLDITRQNVIAPPLPYLQRYDDHFVTNASYTDIDEDIEVGRLIVPKKPKITALVTDDYFVTPTTTTEIIDEVTTQRVIVPPVKPLTTKTIDDTYITPQSITEVDEEMTNQKVFGPPKITTQNVDDLYMHDESETDVIDEETRHRIYAPREPELTIQTVDDYFVHPVEDTEIVDDITKHRVYGPRHPQTKVVDDYYRDMYEIDEIVDDTTSEKLFGPQPTTRIIQTSDDEFVTQSRDVEEFIDDTRHRVMAPRKPKITVKNIDDFYVTNITETETTEQVIKTGRSMPNLALMPEPEDEEERPQIRTGFDITMRSIPLKPDGEPSSRTTLTTLDTNITKTSTTDSIKCQTILRVISNPPETIEDLPKHFPPPMRDKLRTMIITDEVFRTLIIESTTIEEYTERIEKHTFYGPVFEPPTWQVIFRLWSLPEVIDADRREPLKKKRPLDSLRSYRSGFSAHEVRSVTEEDVSFTRRWLTSSHFVPLPDYPTDDESGPHWASNLPEPRRYELYPHDYSPIKPAFGTTPRRPRQRVDPELYTTSSVFGPRHLVNPYTTGSPSVRRRLLEYGQRPYSPDLDALSLESSSGGRSRTYQTYSGSINRQSRMQVSDEREEIKSTTETDVYDWKRYS